MHVDSLTSRLPVCDADSSSRRARFYRSRVNCVPPAPRNSPRDGSMLSQLRELSNARLSGVWRPIGNICRKSPEWNDHMLLQMRDVTLTILAGGRSSRMQTQKANLEVGGIPILEYLLNQARWSGPTMLITAPL